MDLQKKRLIQKNWIKKRRLEWVNSNGPCKLCGSTEQLEIDHIKPEEKEFNIGSIWSRKKAIRDKELKKCQVLCHECHLKKTIAWLQRNNKHGTSTVYRNGCRCKLCVRAKVDEVNEWRWKTGHRKKRN